MEIETIAPAAPDAGTVSEQKPKAEAKPDSAGVQKPDETPAEKKWRLKYGKTEREVSEKELIAEAQKGWAADEKFKAAAKKERDLREAYARGDMEFITKNVKGKNQIEWAKEVLRAELRKKQMSPDELAAEQARQELRQLQEEKLALEAEKTQAKRAERQKFYEDQYDRDLTAAIKANGLPKNKYVIGRAVQIAKEIVDMDLEPDWDLVVKEAKRQVQDEMGELLDQLDDFGFVGEERARKISKWLVNKGMPKAQADKAAVKVVKQEGNDKPDIEPVDSDTYWEKKRAQWSK